MSYLYPIPDQQYRLGRLRQELEHLQFFVNVLKHGHDHNVEFSQEPDQATKDEVDTIVGVHDPSPPKPFQLYNYVPNFELDNTQPPVDIDYRRSLDRRLHPDYVFIKGELQTVTYYEILTFDAQQNWEFSIPVVKVDYVWTRDVHGFIQKRDGTISWFYEDGTEATGAENQKVTEKYYNPGETVREGIRRRANIIDDLKMTMLVILIDILSQETEEDIIQMGRDWLFEYNEELYVYTQFADQATLTAKMANDKTYWMLETVPGTGGKTVAEFLIDEVTY